MKEEKTDFVYPTDWQPQVASIRACISMISIPLNLYNPPFPINRSEIKVPILVTLIYICKINDLF